MKIGICSLTEDAFDAQKFISDVITQNADALQLHFSPDAVIRWHETNEELTLPEYIRANCEYPGAWDGAIERIIENNDGISLVYRISSEGMEFLVVSFIKLADGKITQLDEYFCTCGTAPQWRVDMKIGKPIIPGKIYGEAGW